jgi:ABC-type multidrug transport system permease subunit
MQVGVALRRRVQLVTNDVTVPIQFIVTCVQGLIISSVFYNIPDTSAGFFSRGGVIFFAILLNCLSGMSEIAAMFFQRPITARHKRYAMLRPSADAIARLLVDMPIKFLTIACFDLIVYWIPGLAPTAGQFFVFLLFTFVGSTCMNNYFRMLYVLLVC